jgi:hypothetical protein
MTTNDHVLRDGSIGAASGALSMLLNVLKPLGDVASSVGAIGTCAITLIMLYRLIRGPKKPKQDQPKTEDQKCETGKQPSPESEQS